MKCLQILLITFAFSTPNFAQNFHRNPGETAAEFAGSILPNDSARLVSQVLETKLWDSTKKIIIAFYSATIEFTPTQKEAFKEKVVQGYVFVPLVDGQYKRLLIDTYTQEGADAYVETVFFANADKDKQKELIILCSWDQNGHATISGKLFQVYLYDHLNFTKLPESLKVLHHLDKTFKPEFEGKGDDGKKSTAKYKTVEDIRKKLKALKS
jgi:hypothetical protein